MYRIGSGEGSERGPDALFAPPSKAGELNVGYGSKAAATGLTIGVRFHPESGHRGRRAACPL